MSSIYQYVFIVRVSITESNPDWVGAWWLGPLVFGIIGVVVALPTFLLPKEIPGTARTRIGRDFEVHQSDQTEETEGFGKK